MTLFELVRAALDQLYVEAVEEYNGLADTNIKDRLNYLSTSYKGLTEDHREPIDYKDPATRFAYVYRYVAAHGDYVRQGLAKLSDTQ